MGARKSLTQRRYEWQRECDRTEPRERCPEKDCQNGTVMSYEPSPAGGPSWVECACSTCKGKGYLNGTE